MRLRLGSTSYVYPADILTNVRKLAGLVHDVELVLFEIPDMSNLPDPSTVDALGEMGREHSLSYTVHLPLDLRLGGPKEWRAESVRKAQRVIRSVRPLAPWAYIIHLNPEGENWSAWQEASCCSLSELIEEVGDPARLAVENLENCPVERLDPILEQLPVSLCLDIGHLWWAKLDPLPAFQARFERIRVLHLHGVADRDHRSLLYAPMASLQALLIELVSRKYEGVITLEVFSVEDFLASRALMLSLTEAIGHEGFDHSDPGGCSKR